MARQKNDGKGRIGGRAKGTPNKITSTFREYLTALLNENRKQIEADLKALDPKERLLLLEKLMQYVIPKQQAVNTTIEFDSLSDEQLDYLIDEITKDTPTNRNEYNY